MATLDRRREERLNADAVMALSEDARWEAYDLVARRGAVAAVDFLRGHAGELALSWSAWDQLFALALDQAAAALADGAAIPRVDLSAYLTPCLLPTDTLRAIEKMASELTLDEAARLRAFVCVETAGGGGRSRSHSAATALQQRAALNRSLWSDTRLVLRAQDRALMLAGAEVFDHGAREAAPPVGWPRVLWGRRS